MDALARALERQQLGGEQVTRLCQELAAAVERCRARAFDGPYPYVYLDGRIVAAQDQGGPVPMAVVVAVRIDGREQQELLGCDVGRSADRAFWLGLLQRLAARGLSALPLVAADGQDALKETLAALLNGRQAGSAPGARRAAGCPSIPARQT
jgi:transposase-like protein